MGCRARCFLHRPGAIPLHGDQKRLSPILGLEGYKRIIEQCEQAGIQIPIFAIGGITIDDVPSLMRTGVTGIAISGAIINAEDPVKATQQFIKTINNHKI